jgi:hypothetical protein
MYNDGKNVGLPIKGLHHSSYCYDKGHKVVDKSNLKVNARANGISEKENNFDYLSLWYMMT